MPENKIYYKPADKPTWTPQHAIEVATVFEKIFVDPKGALLGAPRAQYDHMFGNAAGGWQLGTWMVSWPRVDSHGHPFYGDGVNIEIQEGFCPLGIGVNLATPFTEQKGAPLTAAVALGKAESSVSWRQFKEKIFYNCVIADEYQKNVTGDYLLSQQLVVVIPHLSKPKEARLAWEIWFRPRHAKPPSGSWYDEDFSVWIDAYTGDEIGGDAML